MARGRSHGGRSVTPPMTPAVDRDRARRHVDTHIGTLAALGLISTGPRRDRRPRRAWPRASVRSWAGRWRGSAPPRRSPCARPRRAVRRCSPSRGSRCSRVPPRSSPHPRSSLPLLLTRRKRGVMQPPAPAPSTLADLSDAQLARDWHTSYTALAAARDAGSLERICALRRCQLDEIERRTPGGLQRWAESGAWRARRLGAVPRRLTPERPGSTPSVNPPSTRVGTPLRSPYRGPVLRVRLLGDIAAERDGEPVPLSGPHRRLLAFLALHPGPHERDALAARIWPDLPTARANLRTAVWVLRRSLGVDAVDATRTSVALGAGHARPRRDRPGDRGRTSAGSTRPPAPGSTTTGRPPRGPSTCGGAWRPSTRSRPRRGIRPTPRAGRPGAAP